MSPDIYATCLIVFAAMLLYFGMYLILGGVPPKLKGSVYQYSRRFMGAAFLVLVSSIVLFFIAGINKMSIGHRVALNLSCYFIASKLIATSFFTLIGKMPKVSQLWRSRSSWFSLLFPIFVWGLLLIPNVEILKCMFIGCGAILLISIILDVKYFFAKYRNVVEQGEYFYANGIGIHINWMLNSFYLMIGAGLLSAVFALFSTILPKWILFVYLSYFMGVCIYIFNNFILFMTTFGELVEMSSSKDMLPEIDMSKTRLSSDKYQHLHRQIVEWVENKGYCEKKVSIVTLAAQESTNRLYMSNYINTTYKCSFRAWISKLRIDEAKRIFLKNPNESITAVSGQVGFMSLTSFTHAFKQIEGLSPSDWVKSQRR